jgi:hypothetical protein
VIVPLAEIMQDLPHTETGREANQNLRASVEPLSQKVPNLREIRNAIKTGEIGERSIESQIRRQLIQSLGAELSEIDGRARSGHGLLFLRLLYHPRGSVASRDRYPERGEKESVCAGSAV